MATPRWNKARGLWVIQGQHNGVKKTFYSSTPGVSGKREVMSKYDNWIEFGGAQKITVQKCVELYLRDIEARLGRRDTYRQTEIYTRLYVIPMLGRSNMSKLSLRDWQAVLNEARPKSGRMRSLSYKSMTHLRSVLVGLHKFAYINYYADEWRGSLYIPQGHQRGERDILQPSDIARLFEPSGLWHWSTFRVMLLCGLRPSECLGLQESDIRGHTLMIKRAINDSGEITEGKNRNARRTIPLPPMAEKILKETIARNHKRGFGTPWIFCNYYGGPACQSSVRRQWNKLKAERQLPGSLYSLRHTFVSIVSSQTHLAEGTIKEIVGHSDSFDTWGTYKHTVAGEMENAAEIINLTFERIQNAK